MKFLKMWLTVILFFACFSVAHVKAQDRQEITYPAQVEKIVSQEEVDFDGEKQISQKLELKITDKKSQEEKILIDTKDFLSVGTPEYKVGDRVEIVQSVNPDGKSFYYIADYIRGPSLLLLFIIFFFITLLVVKFGAITSFLGMGVSFLVIFFFILPQIASGNNPVLISMLSALFLVPIIFFLSHGFNKKSVIAVIGTYISLFIVFIFAYEFIERANLTGFASEEAGFIASIAGNSINIKGLILAGIIISSLGILDDVTVSQVSVTEELSISNAKIDAWELYKKSMRVGRDHIASMINTLVLVYAGASLPLLLLFTNSSLTFSQAINYEIIAEEIVKTLVGSIGLVLAVPISTIIAAFVYKELD